MRAAASSAASAASTRCGCGTGSCLRARSVTGREFSGEHPVVGTSPVGASGGPPAADITAVRMGYGVRDGFADRSDPTLWWASCLDLDQSIGLATCRGATIGIA